MEDDWRVPERDLKSCDSAMGLGAAPTSSSRIIMTGLARNGKPVFVAVDTKFLKYLHIILQRNKMANTRNDVVIPEGEWVDLFALSGVTVGSACTVFNKSVTAHFIAISTTAPPLPLVESTKMPKGIINYVGGVGVNVSTGASGLWAYSPQGTSYALVQD